MKTLAIAVTMFALALAPATWAQESPSPQDVAQAQAKGSEQSLTGCLESQENAFILRTSAGEIQLEGDSLSANVGKTIQVTGTSATQAGKRIFKVSAVTVVSPSCRP